MSTYFARDKSASTSVRANGIYFGVVARVDLSLRRVWVEIARLNRGFQYGPLPVVGPVLPSVGDRVACEFVEDKTNEMVVLGVVKNGLSDLFLVPVVCTSTSRPVVPVEGTQVFETDTGLNFQFVDGEWVPFGVSSGRVEVVSRVAVYGEDPESQAYEVLSTDLGLLIILAPDASESPSNPLVEIVIDKGVGSVGSRIEFVHDLFSTGSFAFGLTESADALFLPPTGKLAAPRNSGSLVTATKVYENVEVGETLVDIWLLSGDLADDV